MSSEVLYRKWRPQTLGEVMGQEAVTTTLLNAVRGGRVGHAYLFCGPRGTGKTSTGRILAKAVNCLQPHDGEPCNVCEACRSISEGRCLDVIEIDAASNRGVDDIRQLRERVHYAAGTVQRKVYIVDEVHMLTDAASNALLKTLEEPPPHVMFILATTEFHKVLPTIVSRCQSFHFRRLALNAIAAKLRVVCQREDIDTDDDTLTLIARSAGGSLRDAENMLQQLLASLGSHLQIDAVRIALGIADESYVTQLIHGLSARDMSVGLRTLHQASDAGVDMRQLGRQIVAALRDAMLIRSACEDIVDGGPERVEALGAAAADMPVDRMAAAARRFSEAIARDATQPLLSLELALVDCLVASAAPPPAESDGAPVTPAQKRVDGRKGAGGAAREPVRRAVPRTRPEPTTPPEPVRPVAAIEPPAVDIAAGPGQREAPPADVSERTQVDATMQEAPGVAAEPSGPDVVAAGPTDEGELAHVRATWKQYVDSLRGLGSTGNVDAFLRSACEPIALTEEGVLVLRFLHAFHKRKFEDAKALQVVEDGLRCFYGRPFKVSCVLDAPGDATSGAPTSQQGQGGLVDGAVRMGWRLKSLK